MRFIEATEAEVRRLAAERGIDPTAAVEMTIHGGGARAIWDRLRAGIPADDPARAAVDKATLQFTPSVALIAQASMRDGRAIVRIHLGVLESMSELTRTLTPLLGDSIDGGARGLSEELVERTGIRIAHSLGWLTSRAQHARVTPEHDLSQAQETFAHGLAIAAQMFVLAHEMGHVASGDLAPAANRASAHKREFAADAWAIERLLALSRDGGRTRDPGESTTPPTLADIPWPAHLTIPAAAVFLCLDALRQRFAGIDSSDTHPSAVDRLAAIRARVVRAGLEPEVLEGFDVVLEVFDFLLPHVQRQHPDWVLKEDELREIVALSGGDPSTVPDGASATWREVYTNETIGVLRELTAKEAPSDEDVASVVALVARMPQVVIDVLGRAYDGKLLPQDDPDALAVHRLGQVLVGRFGDDLLREALIPG